MERGGGGFESLGYEDESRGDEKEEPNLEEIRDQILENLTEAHRQRFKEAQERVKEDLERYADYKPHEFIEVRLTDWEKEIGQEVAPEEILAFMLSKLIEEGPDWSPQRRQAVRQFIVCTAQHLLGRANARQAELMRESILSPEYLAFVGEIDDRTQKLADKTIEARWDITEQQ